ncbi:PDZ domain-containing protein [Luteolibacter flavescens]|uniref:PDZ domain-containing protein n=2 Tax=Luteolibacter flavescens TaxID=1859460 RepID=A0ABT3FIF9_9BACT|nr:PDZ domain-containing protein [Luteolibacter flavescens]
MLPHAGRPAAPFSRVLTRGERNALIEVQRIEHAEAGQATWLGLLDHAFTSPVKSWIIGVIADPISSGDAEAKVRGLLVRDVVPSSPAHRAGLRRNDVILRVNGNPVATQDELSKCVQDAGNSGHSVNLEWLRRSDPHSAVIKPEGGPPKPTASAQDPDQLRIEELEKRQKLQQQEIDELRQEIQKLKDKPGR